ncbi:hypothetical protein DRO69_12825 [Candidatus Bathyarchaeota archaeon]|nr:MAG: hypothetical protein DRO69_12825 [Candidatus Bathyarchaeota archaeon]
MSKNVASLVILIMSLTCLLSITPKVQRAESSGTIYIRANGSIEPLTAPISSVDNVTYVFTDNIYESIVVERDNIVVDGVNYNLKGTIALPNRFNVTIKNMKIEGGIGVSGTYNRVYGNVISNCTRYGISLGGSFNSIFGNNIIGCDIAIHSFQSSNNSIFENNIENNRVGIWLGVSDHNNIYGNRISRNNEYGIYLGASSGNNLTNNNIENNAHGIYIYDNSEENIVKGNQISQNTMEGLYVGGKSDTNILVGNIITSNHDGIVVWGSSWNCITENEVTEINGTGIFLLGTGNVLRNNSMVNNRFNFEFYGRGELSSLINDIDTSNRINGKSIYYLVNRQDLTVPTNASYVALVNCKNVTIQNLELSNNGQGIMLAFTTDSVVTQNVIVANKNGITLYSSSNIHVSRNRIMKNNEGTMVPNGLCLISSPNNTIYRNEISYNYDGVVLDNSQNTKIIGNNIASNSRSGILLSSSSDYLIYHNNFINNSMHVYVHSLRTGNHSWDNGYPSGGNYWDDYVGKNMKGVGYPPYPVADSQDNYPLMGPINIFDAGVWNNQSKEIHIVSNSTVSDFQFDTSHKIISFNVIGVDYTAGFCRVTIPKYIVQDWWQNEYVVLVNGQQIAFETFTDAEDVYLYFTYQHSEHNVIIVPEYSLLNALVLFIVVTTMILGICRKKRIYGISPLASQR